MRAVVTDRLTACLASWLIARGERHELLDEIRKAIDHTTDEEVDEVCSPTSQCNDGGKNDERYNEAATSLPWPT